MRWEDDGDDGASAVSGAGQGGVAISREALEARYAGIAIFARPRFRFDQRTPEVGQVVQRHWFWGAFSSRRRCIATCSGRRLVNVFALAMPLFVHERVRPRGAQQRRRDAVDAGAGILLVLGVDYALRLLRGHFVDLASARIDVKLSALIMERVLGMRMADKPASVGSFAANLRSFESVRDFIASATVTALIDCPSP
jgi:ATP-binding cassette subfamily C protein LapB